ncbi:hypothetical protein [Marinicella gelatinilytica]|uniref:hypothetical protein n=1 Tax=Marinicella gelatinilytica TaxID=2996017 RepID=UPI0022609EBF|nr:hypothetical protein [Marinicella gelatinilytica]MCX7544558.1 hypothetical protein [Marinicella gelatinilytica]
MNTPVVFTPLRVILMAIMILANLATLAALVMPEASWADAVGLFGIVFVMMFVFVILLELTWLHHRGKNYTAPQVQKKYRMAKWIYLIVLISGIIMGLIYLL